MPQPDIAYRLIRFDFFVPYGNKSKAPNRSGAPLTDFLSGLTLAPAGGGIPPPRGGQFGSCRYGVRGFPLTDSTHRCEAAIMRLEVRARLPVVAADGLALLLPSRFRILGLLAFALLVVPRTHVRIFVIVDVISLVFTCAHAQILLGSGLAVSLTSADSGNYPG
jgi:hypothetical protein